METHRRTRSSSARSDVPSEDEKQPPRLSLSLRETHTSAKNRCSLSETCSAAVHAKNHSPRQKRRRSERPERNVDFDKRRKTELEGLITYIEVRNLSAEKMTIQVVGHQELLETFEIESCSGENLDSALEILVTSVLSLRGFYASSDDDMMACLAEWRRQHIGHLCYVRVRRNSKWICVRNRMAVAEEMLRTKAIGWQYARGRCTEGGRRIGIRHEVPFHLPDVEVSLFFSGNSMNCICSFPCIRSNASPLLCFVFKSHLKSQKTWHVRTDVLWQLAQVYKELDAFNKADGLLTNASDGLKTMPITSGKILESLELSIDIQMERLSCSTQDAHQVQ